MDCYAALARVWACRHVSAELTAEELDGETFTDVDSRRVHVNPTDLARLGIS